MIPTRVKEAAKVLLGRRSYRAEDPAKIARDAQQYWTAAASQTTKQDLSHWRGVGRWANDEKWKQVGDEHYSYYEKLRVLADRHAPVASMLEWGPGGGANATRFMQAIPEFIAVDISQPNLDECGRQIQSQGLSGYLPILIDATNPESALDKVGKPIDFFLCTAVYQHFPSKEYGKRVTKVASKMLKADGIALIQTRYDDGTERYLPKNRDYDGQAVSFSSYRIEEFWMLVQEAGLMPLAVVLNPSVHYAFYLLRKA
jgi:2-polyprenyl-3-methyl-5-hydroxy-6-metoxy-1,4-benzoquinol methylase